ncbi:MAG: secretin N-terminal domain-containing protein [Armatimonadota bacterium]
MIRWLLPMLMLAILWLPRLAAGQEQSYCQFQGVTVTRVSNGLRISLKADGVIEAKSERWVRWDWYQRIPFNLNNMRGGAASIITIGQYPISHIEFTPLKGAKDGIGMRCTLVFAKWAWLAAFDSPPDTFDDSYYTWWDRVPRVMIKRTQQGNELLIMIISDKPVAPEPPAIENAKVQLELGGTPDRLTLHALNADLRDVVERISDSTGRTIYLSGDISRKVTMHLENLPVERLLASLARGYALSLADREEAFYLSPGSGDSAAGYWATTMRSIPLQYLSPGDARSMLPDALLSYITPNPDARAVTVTGAPALIEKIEQDLRAIDQPSYHCVIQAWVISDESSKDELVDVIARAVGGNTSIDVNGRGDIAVQRVDGEPGELLLKLKALARSKTMTVKAVPTVQVANGQYANLFIGNTIYYWTMPDAKLNSVDAGTRLRVTPLTSGEWITVSYRAEDRFLRERNDLGPLIMKRTFDGTIRIRTGDTLLVGGLQMDTSELRRGKLLSSKWPFTVSANARRIRQQVWVLLKAEAVLNPISPTPPAGETPALRQGESLL